VNLLLAQTQLGRSRQKVRALDLFWVAPVPRPRPFLRRVVLVGEAGLRGSLDDGCIRLSSVGGPDQLIMRAFGLGEAAGALSGVEGNARHVAGLEDLGGGPCARKRLRGPVDKGRKILRGAACTGVVIGCR
jgi:hypothetical protein